MESEEVLSSIMNKLKEYKSNPLSSQGEEKERQKNLIKMFCIYTSLKKREKAKQKLKENNATNLKEQNIENQKTLDDRIQNSKTDPYGNNRISSDNSTKNDDTYQLKAESESLEYKSYQSDELCSDFSPASQECTKTEKVFDEIEESCDENIEEHEHSLNQFLIQLSERLKKLPYRQRSKLEIEFFRRMIEVEEGFRSYNN